MLSIVKRSPWRSSLAAVVSPSDQSTRAITHKASRIEDPLTSHISPWPYKERGYTKTHSMIDGTHKRLGPNSKIIVVDGNMGSGKSTMARDIADQLDFYHMPEFNVDTILVNSYGNDLRDYYDKLPKNQRVPDDKMFYADPSTNTSLRVCHMLIGRYEQWLNAVAHVLNTGQGVVLERSIYSDFVLVNALREKGLISAQYFRVYHWLRNVYLMEARFMPHLCVYIDTPFDKCIEHSKQSNPDSTKNLIDEQFLKTIHESYNDMLMEFKNQSKVLIYDWEKNLVDGVDRVIEDIENIDFDFFDRHSVTENRAWFAPVDDFEWCRIRHDFTDKSNKLYPLKLFAESFDIAELYSTPPELQQRYAVMKKYMFKDGYAYGSHPDEFKTNWYNQLTNFKPYSFDPANKWFDHFFKDTHFLASQSLTPDEWADWDGKDHIHAAAH